MLSAVNHEAASKLLKAGVPTMPLVHFPSTVDPVLSVVVLAWRQTDHLVECLAAVLASEDAPPYEVVLVLNGATEEVREVVREQIAGALTVDVTVNVGFGGGCNLGASHARGEHILFLNDDAVVAPSLLAALTRRMTAEPDVGAVAAVLLNSDGTLQEAGSRVVDGAGTVQLGAGLAVGSQEAQSFLTPRDIDYGSGAALLVRHDAFTALGGFDPIYEPAYFEDVDLSFRLKESGWRVVLEPTAEARHFSGASTSTDTRFRRYASDHAGTHFLERWKDVLADAPERDAHPTEILRIPRAERPAADGFSGTPAEKAASIANGYSAWLLVETDRLESQLAAIAEQLEAEREHSRALEKKVDSLNVVAHGLRIRLDDLESRGPVGLVKWRLGIIKNRPTPK
jgi:GT2 family glycosyltransferase